MVVIAVVVMLVRGGIGGSSYSDSGAYDTSGSQTSDIFSGMLSEQSSGGTTGYSASSSGSMYSEINDSEADRTVSDSARDKYTVLKGDGTDTATVMVYICGSNLESDNGMATSDLNEMASAALNNENVHVVVETGGAKKWRNSVIKPGALGRYEIVSGGIKPLDTNVRSQAMTDPEVLSDFIKFAANTYPADRYMLILWDHGGGSVSGYGYDELYPNGSMRLDGVANALKASGLKFDFVGFDACLMAGMETAIAIEPYADYLIASEETEPGTGWYYTNWLSELSKNPSTETVEIGKHIVDDFLQHSGSSARAKTTLSVTDLADFAGLIPSNLSAFGQNLSSEIKSENYQTVANARADTREFSSRIDQVDLVDFCENLGSAEAGELAKAVKQSVKYNRSNVPDAWGMSIYFPYSSLKSMKSMTEIYENIDMDESFTASVKSFATLESSGQIASSSNQGGYGSLMGSLMTGGASSSSSFGSSDLTSLLMQAMLSGAGARNIPENAVDVSYDAGYPGAGTDYSSILGGSADWMDESEVKEAASYIEKHSLNGVDLSVTEKEGQKVLHLAEDEWKNVQTLELNVFYDDGEGYVDLGLDNTFDFDNDGNLLGESDGTWLAVNGQPVAYYHERTSGGVTTGYIPAFLNGERVELLVVFDDANPRGSIVGARRVYTGGETETVAKNTEALQQGDQIDFLCDYYTYDGVYQDTYYLGETLTVNGTLRISNVPLGDGNLHVTYRFTDIYQQHYWTAPLNY